jgi:hypothetical protein
MLLYHTTTRDRADAIMVGGFQDGKGRYMTDREWTGVWLSEQPLDEQSGGRSGDAIAVNIPTEIVGPWEWVEDHKPYREFLVPADLVNQYPRTLVRDWQDQL